jgi:hypothetical protein
MAFGLSDGPVSGPRTITDRSGALAAQKRQLIVTGANTIVGLGLSLRLPMSAL